MAKAYIVEEVEAFQSYLRRQGMSKNTAYNYGLDLSAFFKWVDEREGRVVPVEEIKAKHCKDFMGYLTELELAAAARNRKSSALRHFFNWLVEEENRIEYSPAAHLKNAKLPKRLPKPINRVDIELLLNAAADMGIREKVMMEIFYGCGLRREELTKLTPKSFDFRTKIVRFIGKGDKERIVPISGIVVEAVKNLIEDNPVNCKWLFPSTKNKGTHMSLRRVNEIIDGISKRAGLEGEEVTPHMIRHSCATHMYEEGADIKTIQDILGHASPQTTQGYTQVSVNRNQLEHAKFHPRTKMGSL